LSSCQLRVISVATYLTPKMWPQTELLHHIA